MIKLINLIKDKLGVDGAIFWSVFNRGIGLLKGPFTVYFIVKYLSTQEQGLWYTFVNLSALTMLVDLGFTQIISQFISHEYAALKEVSGKLVGKSGAVDRMMALTKFSIRFYSYVILIATSILMIVGHFYFRSETRFILFAWYLYAVIGGINLFGSLLLSIYQGLDKIVTIQKNMLIGSIANSLCTWGMLMLHFKIWALLAGSFLSILITLVLLYRSATPLWWQIIKYRVYDKYNFLKETIPLQWRYAISFICSYLLVYAYVPATFKLVGPIEAGQLGLTLTIMTVINGVANSWVVTKVPKLNVLVAQGNYSDLNSMFKKSITIGLFIQVFLSCFTLFGIFILTRFLPSFAKRFLDMNLIFWLLISQIPAYFITGFSLYLRAFKKEPFMILLVINAITMVISIYFLLYREHAFNLFIYSIGFVNTLILLFGLIIYMQKRKIYLSTAMQSNVFAEHNNIYDI